MPDIANYISNLSLGADIHLMDVSVAGDDRQPLLKVIVDTPGGVTIAEIAQITRSLRRDEGLAQEVGTQDFRLEVSSPGLETGLTEPWQFDRHVGRRIAVQLQALPEEHGNRVKGRLLRTGQEGIVVQMPEGETEIAWTEIQQASVQLEW